MEKGDLKSFLKETGLFIVDIFYNAIIIVLLVILIRSFLISPFRVVGASMADTLANEEFILIDKFSYLLGDIGRGDPIVFLPPATSKDAPKFEELVVVGPDGMGQFELKDLHKASDRSYCQTSSLFNAFWFCREQVELGDLIYYAPRQKAPGNSGQRTDWSLVKRGAIDKASHKEGVFEFEGEPGLTYMLRVYDSMGPEYFVKRVIGVPGDTVKIESGRVYLKTPDEADFRQINEPFLNEENADRTYISQKQRENVYEVPEGQYFVLGDNRNHSNDSRSWLEPITQDAFAFVPEANVSGKVLVVLWPITDFRFIGSAEL